MNGPANLIRELMARVHREMYAGKPEKTWFAQQAMVKKALTYPAKWLHERHVPLSEKRYREIMDGVITTMIRNGDLAKIEFMSRYILHCVQKHMEHHGDEYYTEGKGMRNRLDVFMGKLEKQRQHTDTTVEVLAGAHAALQIGKRQAKKKPQSAPELGLFSRS